MQKQLDTIAIVLISAALMIYLQFNPANPQFCDNDSFYHVKMAELIQERGPEHVFPWLSQTVLRDDFVNMHFLFHVALIPWISLVGPVNGPKAFQVIIGVGIFTLFYLILATQIPWALPLSVLTLFCMPADFYYRLNMIRDIGFQLLLLLAGILCALRHRWMLVAIVNFFFVWSLGGLVYLPVFLVLLGVSKLLTNHTVAPGTVIVLLVAMVVGILLNPYFSEVFPFLKMQLFDTGLGASSYAGREWFPYDTWQWFKDHFYTNVIVTGGFILTALLGHRQSPQTLSFVVFGCLLTIVEFKTRRAVEYAPIFMALGGLMVLISNFKNENGDSSLYPKLARYGKIVILLMAFFAAIDLENRTLRIASARKMIVTQIELKPLQLMHDYLKANSFPGEIVFTDDWDVFPYHFFMNSFNSYVVGLDPTFMVNFTNEHHAKGELFEKFAKISSGRAKNLIGDIKTVFKAGWVLVQGKTRFYKNLMNHPQLVQEVFSTHADPMGPFRNESWTLFKVL